MDLKTIDEQFKQAARLLDQNRMKEALALLEPMAQTCGDYQLLDELHAVQTSYRYMLQYMEQGMNDPERKTLYHDLLAKSYVLADQIYLASQEGLSQKYYFAIRRQYKLHSQDISMEKALATLESFQDSVSVNQLLRDEKKLIEDLEMHEAVLHNMFMTTWINSRWNHAEKECAYKYLSSESITSNDLSIFVSAVTMSLLNCFDEAKMLWLLETFYHKDTQVKIRAQVGFVLVVHKHYKRIGLYPGIMARISLMQDEQASFADDINDIFIQLLRSQDTERINKTMNEEIVPEVMKKVQDMQQRKNILEDSDEMDMNPEWMFDLGSKLNNKMRKIGELQMEGGDVNMATFSHMKRFKFFESMSNWFYPFEPLHSSVVRTLGINPTGKSKLELKFLQIGMFCNSDSYSLIFMMQQMAEDQRRIVLEQISSNNIEGLIQEAGSDKLSSYITSPIGIRRFYIQDLYRFFKLFPLKGEFTDPFSSKLALYMNPILSPILQEPHLLQKAADFQFKAERYNEAIETYAFMISKGANVSDIYQRAGFCEQKRRNYEQAINYYEKADIANTGNAWTLRHLAACYRHQSEFQKALDCYEQLLKKEPENLTFVYGKACCLMERLQYEEALQCFYQIDLTEDNNLKAWRGIAWCCFMTGKMKQAHKYYDRIINSKPTATDWLNAGHASWCSGNLSQALERYRNAASLSTSPDVFRESLFGDKEILMSKGISSTDFLLMMELI